MKGTLEAIIDQVVELKRSNVDRLDFEEAAKLKDIEDALRRGPCCDFAALRQANITRAKEFNPHGVDMGLPFAVLELAGEVGELANALKKVIRHEHGIVGGSNDLQAVVDELADVIISADLVAMALNVDLADIVTRKFNATSEKHGLKTRFVCGAKGGDA
ncbi:MAG: MazG nucleotide pyrophosphohydrolase domain-containing protein [Pseudolabrys sp.]|nr:MazG nucleotide pyrophosphohydrolase domain-containing protein [Pseudolabrys sp.]